MKNKYFRFLWLAALGLQALIIAPIKWVIRKFTLWRLQLSRRVLLDEYGHGRLTSNLLHRLDAEILRRGGLAALLALMLGFGLNARAQSQNPAIITATNLPAWPLFTMTNGAPGGNGVFFYSFGSTASNFVPLYINSGLAVQACFCSPTNSGTNILGTAAIYFYPSVVGTNPINNGGLPWAIIIGTPNTTNAVFFGTNWSQLALNGFRGMFYTVSNGCGLPIQFGGLITNTVAGGTITNVYQAGITFTRPYRP